MTKHNDNYQTLSRDLDAHADVLEAYIADLADLTESAVSIIRSQANYQIQRLRSTIETDAPLPRPHD